MRSTILLLAAASFASARWFKWTENRDQIWRPEETGHVDFGEALTAGWSPKPTQAPGEISAEQRVLRVLKRQTVSNTWLNSKTCGYFSGPACKLTLFHSTETNVRHNE
jgi:hypothetical protein